MADFLSAHKIVMGNEGGYVNDPNDSGGETYKGIARKKHPEWVGWTFVDVIKAQLNPFTAHGFNIAAEANPNVQTDVLSFYKSEFWDALNLDNVNNQAIAVELYDTAVNMGQGVAGLFLQRALNIMNHNGADYPDLKKDGKIGPITISALNNHKAQGNILKVLNVLQGERYINIMEANPKQEKYFTSWFSRVTL